MSESPLQPYDTSASIRRMREVPGGAFSLLGESRGQNGIPLGAGSSLPVGGDLGAG